MTISIVADSQDATGEQAFEHDTIIIGSSLCNRIASVHDEVYVEISVARHNHWYTFT